MGELHGEYGKVTRSCMEDMCGYQENLRKREADRVGGGKAEAFSNGMLIWW